MKSKTLRFFAAAVMMMMFAGGCAANQDTVKLDPKNPVTVSIWHYYNGAIMNAFNGMVQEFNETVGAEKGIIIEHSAYGNITELEKAVSSSINKDIGSLGIPNIFASYADTAYQAEELDLLANLNDYFTAKEQAEYLTSFIEEGKIGHNGELRIFPIAKSTEAMMVNETDWLPFAEANGVSYEDLGTMEGVAKVSEMYYNWTDARTPDKLEDGLSFFGRDVMANFFIVASKQFDTEIFKVENGKASININTDVMRKIWDYYYVPFINGYYSAYGKFRSDDTKVGDILAYVGSTASAAYFPKEVNIDGNVYPVQAKVLSAPLFENGKRVMIQQGAGMVVTKSTPQEEYASVVFLKWFTDTNNNIEFSSLSGYLPVKTQALDYNVIKSIMVETNITLHEVTDITLLTAIDNIKTSELYTNKAFNGGVAARAILEHNLQDKAVADRAAVLKLIEGGSTRQQAVAQYDTDENFDTWLDQFTQLLNETF